MWRDARLVASKDLRLELRSRVALNQILPFSMLVLFLFAFALNPDRGLLSSATAGLFWIAVLFSSLLILQRAFAVEAADGADEALLLAGLDPTGIFLGKAAAAGLQLLALEVFLICGVVVLYGTELRGVGLLLATCLTATTGIVAVGTIHGALAAGVRVGESLLPLLLLPVVAPIMIGATRAFEAALEGVSADGWPWIGLLSIFAAVYTALGLVTFGSLLEDS